jgi:hypothetical protein
MQPQTYPLAEAAVWSAIAAVLMLAAIYVAFE